jgi:hypothetical protein
MRESRTRPARSARKIERRVERKTTRPARVVADPFELRVAERKGIRRRRLPEEIDVLPGRLKTTARKTRSR